ncbi:MAG: hypothetical protein ACKV19_04280 [Verrucomicrobiales bacterium]
MALEFNPYQPPSAGIPLPSTRVAGQAEAIRKEHLTTETNIRGIGCLWMLSLPLAVAVVFTMYVEGSTSGGMELVFGGLVTLLMLTQGVVGIMLRNLNPAARIPAIVLACIGLIGFPIGTLISVLILLALCRARGKRVLSPGYNEIRAATRHIKYKTPVWIWIFLIIIILAVLGAIAFPIVASKM